MRFLVALAVAAAFVGAGCIDSKACHAPTAWKPCSGEMAQPGAAGTPPTILDFELPTCADLTSPMVTATLHVTDPDADAQVIKATFYTGVRNNEAELELDDAGRNGNDWEGSFGIVIVGAMGGMLMEGTDDVRVKVTDRAGGQSAPFCNSISILR